MWTDARFRSFVEKVETPFSVQIHKHEPHSKVIPLPSQTDDYESQMSLHSPIQMNNYESQITQGENCELQMRRESFPTQMDILPSVETDNQEEKAENLSFPVQIDDCKDKIENANQSVQMDDCPPPGPSSPTPVSRPSWPTPIDEEMRPPPPPCQPLDRLFNASAPAIQMDDCEVSPLPAQMNNGECHAGRAEINAGSHQETEIETEVDALAV